MGRYHAEPISNSASASYVNISPSVLKSTSRPGRAEDRRPFVLIGFGAGSHRCLGKDLAILEMKILLGRLLRRHALELVDPDPVPKRGPDPNRPRAPVRIRYRRRGVAASPP